MGSASEDSSRENQIQSGSEEQGGIPNGCRRRNEIQNGSEMSSICRARCSAARGLPHIGVRHAVRPRPVLLAGASSPGRRVDASRLELMRRLGRNPDGELPAVMGVAEGPARFERRASQ